MSFATRRTERVPLLLIAGAETRVLDVASLRAHLGRLRHVVNLGAPHLLELRHARNGVAVNLLPAREPDLVIDLVADRLRLLARKVCGVEREKESAEVNLGRHPVWPWFRQHLRDWPAAFE